MVPTALDIYPSRSYADNALVQPQSRAAFHRLLEQGWTDALRTLHPDDHLYSFLDYKRQRFEPDAGLRLDHLLLSPNLTPRLRRASVDKAVRAEPLPSDHVPVWIELG